MSWLSGLLAGNTGQPASRGGGRREPAMEAIAEAGSDPAQSARHTAVTILRALIALRTTVHKTIAIKALVSYSLLEWTSSGAGASWGSWEELALVRQDHGR